MVVRQQTDDKKTTDNNRKIDNPQSLLVGNSPSFRGLLRVPVTRQVTSAVLLYNKRVVARNVGASPPVADGVTTGASTFPSLRRGANDKTQDPQTNVVVCQAPRRGALLAGPDEVLSGAME